MTQAVPTNGFNVPGGAPGNDAPPPPAAQVPGFAPQVPPVGQPAPVAQPITAAAPQLDASIAALVAALNAGKTAAPGPAAVQAPENTSGKLNGYNVDTIQDPILRSMATVMQTVGKGMDMDRALGLAIERGDVTLIDKAYIMEKGGENSAQLLTIAEGIVRAVEAQSVAVTGEVHALAGGEAGWQTSVAAFNATAPQALRQVVAQMLDSENKTQILAAAKLVVEAAKGSGVVPNPRGLITNGGSAASAAQALSKEGFQEALRTLNPQDRNYQNLRADLFARRTQGKQLGM